MSEKKWLALCKWFFRSDLWRAKSLVAVARNATCCNFGFSNSKGGGRSVVQDRSHVAGQIPRGIQHYGRLIAEAVQRRERVDTGEKSRWLHQRIATCCNFGFLQSKGGVCSVIQSPVRALGRISRVIQHHCRLIPEAVQHREPVDTGEKSRWLHQLKANYCNFGFSNSKGGGCGVAQAPIHAFGRNSRGIQHYGRLIPQAVQRRKRVDTGGEKPLVASTQAKLLQLRLFEFQRWGSTGSPRAVPRFRPEFAGNSASPPTHPGGGATPRTCGYRGEKPLVASTQAKLLQLRLFEFQRWGIRADPSSDPRFRPEFAGNSASPPTLPGGGGAP